MDALVYSLLVVSIPIYAHSVQPVLRMGHCVCIACIPAAHAAMWRRVSLGQFDGHGVLRIRGGSDDIDYYEVCETEAHKPACMQLWCICNHAPYAFRGFVPPEYGGALVCAR